LIDDGRSITRRTFLKHVNRAQLRAKEAELGYESHYKRGLTMNGDYHVRYCKYKGIYFFVHSCIEFVFATEQQIRAVEER